MNDKKFPILFVGAGPGDPELITVKGQRALQMADVVIYAGSLVPEAVLKWAPSQAITINSAPLHLEQIIHEMKTAYHQYKRVIRLHTGDPSLYGAIFEQMVELDKIGIPYEVVPGVTAAFAAAAAMKIEYTIPELSQTIILTRMAGRTPVPEKESLESLASHQTSLVIYLSISLIDNVQQILEATYGHDAPCAVAYCVSQPNEKIIITTVRQLSNTVKTAGIQRQAIIIVGKILDAKQRNLAYLSKLYDKTFSHGFRG